MRTLRRFAALGLFAALALASGCAAAHRNLTARDYWPRKTAWKDATIRALKDPGTWAPAAGAALMTVDDWDRGVSDWAVRSTPVFGSNERALEASDDLRLLTSLAMIGTSLAVPNGKRAWEFKPERLAIEAAGIQLGNVLTGALKSATSRKRPDGSDLESFPSAHASQAFSRATMACRNVDAIPSLGRAQRITLKTTFRAIAAATAWARVEGGVHYPSDVLFGAALGNFIAVFVHDAFLPPESSAQLGVVLGPGEASVSVTFSF